MQCVLLKYLSFTGVKPPDLGTFQILPCIFLENIYIAVTKGGMK